MGKQGGNEDFVTEEPERGQCQMTMECQWKANGMANNKQFVCDVLIFDDDVDDAFMCSLSQWNSYFLFGIPQLLCIIAKITINYIEPTVRNKRRIYSGFTFLRRTFERTLI